MFKKNIKMGYTKQGLQVTVKYWNLEEWKIHRDCDENYNEW